MKKSVVGKWCLGIAAALLVTYGGVMTARTKDAADFVLIPYPWVWWLLAALAVFAVLGAILTDWPLWSKKAGSAPSTAAASSPPAAAGSSSPAIGPTYNNTFHGPANVAQSSTGVEQTNAPNSNTPAPSQPVSGGMRIAGPWTEHEGLRSSWMIGDKPRPVRWISNGAKLGDLHQAAKGGGWDVYDVAGTYLGGVPTEKAGMKLLKKHES